MPRLVRGMRSQPACPSGRRGLDESRRQGLDVGALTLPASVKQGSPIKLIATLTAGKAKATKSRAGCVLPELDLVEREAVALA